VKYYDLVQEEALTRALLASKRPCIVRNSYLVHFWTEAVSFRDGPFSRAMQADFKLAGMVGHYELWLPRATSPDLVLSVFPITQDKELLERYGARRAFRLRFPTDGNYVISHIALRNARTGLDILDSASPTAERRMTALTPEGAEILQYPSAEPLDPRRMSEVVLLLPRFKLGPGAQELLFRAYGPDGRVVARLLPQTAR
jgi:hypothetical protein